MSINRLPSENKARLLPSPTTRQVQRSEALDVTRIVTRVVTRVVTVQRPVTLHYAHVTAVSTCMWRGRGKTGRGASLSMRTLCFLFHPFT